MSAGRILSLRPGQEAAAIRTAAALLRGGRLVVVPTDTVYGVAADPRAPGAEQRLAAAKARDPAKPVALLAPDLDSVRAGGARLTAADERLAAAFWPGPLTLVLPTPGGPEGFRVPDHRIMLALLREVGGLLRVSSANLSGEPPALTAAEAARALGAAVAVVLDAGPAPGGAPSTVVKTEEGAVRILRAGAIPAARIEAVSRALDGGAPRRGGPAAAPPD